MKTQSHRSSWSTAGRSAVFLLAGSSIACLLFDFYRLCTMRLFTLSIFLPAVAMLLALAVFNLVRGDGQLGRAVMVGLLGGLVAAVAYDLFRLPFVFAREWHLSGIIPPLSLFKVFPRFGAMILGEPIEQTSYSLTAQVLGWIYHFSNGATFGVMYLALIRDAAKQHWSWAVAFALVLELSMLFTPYPAVFNISVTPRFVVITVLAHAVFGVSLGLSARSLWQKWRIPARLIPT